MFGTISNNIARWREHRRQLALHTETLEAYKRKDYPANPSIGIGLAYQKGLISAEVVCQHSWIGHALHEGPVFLQSWRDATNVLKIRGIASYAPYLPKEALEAGLGLFKASWAKGWPAEEQAGESASMQVVRWVHEHDPYWIGRNLDTVFFSSSASMWDTLYHHDVFTSRWAATMWPTREVTHTVHWNDWLANDASWFYPMTRNSHLFSPTKWLRVAEHLSRLAPLKTAPSEEKIQGAIALLGDGRKYEKAEELSHRGLFWKAMTYGVPPSIADPTGAALSCLWPGMEPDLLAIARHFNPNIGTNLFFKDASLPEQGVVTAIGPSASAARTTCTLYEDPLLWAGVFLQTCADNAACPNNMPMELPSNFLD